MSEKANGGGMSLPNAVFEPLKVQNIEQIYWEMTC